MRQPRRDALSRQFVAAMVQAALPQPELRFPPVPPPSTASSLCDGEEEQVEVQPPEPQPRTLPAIKLKKPVPRPRALIPLYHPAPVNSIANTPAPSVTSLYGGISQPLAEELAKLFLFPPKDPSVNSILSAAASVLDERFADGGLDQPITFGPTTPTASQWALNEKPKAEWPYKTPEIMTAKHRVYVKGLKRQIICNRLPDPEQEKSPLFILEEQRAKLAETPRTMFPCDRAAILRKFKADTDLVHYLKMESAFVPRTPALALQLKQKARKWMAAWDLSNYNSKQIHDMTMAAIGQAMLVDQWEEDMRALMHIGPERKWMRPAHNAFFREGRTGVGATTSLSHPSGKVSAWRRYLLRPLTRATLY